MYCSIVYHPVNHHFRIEYLILFGLIWMIYMLMKSMRPAEFSEINRRPYIYFRMYSGRAGRYFEDFKILGNLASMILSFMVLTYLLGGDKQIYHYIIAGLFLTGLYILIAMKVFSRWKPQFTQINFLKWIYSHYFSFILSFLLFVIWFVPIAKNIKIIFVSVIVLLFYFLYLKVVYKISKEQGLKIFHIILYLCMTEILPVSVLIFILSNLV